MKTSIVIILTIIIIVEGNDFDDSYNLPKSIKPLRYIITMEPELDEKIINPIFNGSAVIELQILEATKNITLHSSNLNITEDAIKIVNENGNEVKLVNTFIDVERDFYVIHLANELEKGIRYNLTIGEFLGNLEGDNFGFYLAKYETETGKERNLAVSDFEPIGARQAFPCFDEPALKATFIINLIRPENYISLSNEEILVTTDLGGGHYHDTYKETVPMSTYLVAFIVCDFKHTPIKERHRIFAEPQAVNSGKLDYALSESIEVLKALEQFTGVNYTLNKLDQVAVPRKYFNTGAMENWGLITYSEKYLFITNETSTTEDIQRCTTYIAHEFSHQWFGNLVTFNSWKYMWLSEGFGAYLEYKIISLIKPTWMLREQFVLEKVHSIFVYDSSNSTQPMNYQPQKAGKIPSYWTCYVKASSVIRMMEHFLTTDVFRNGLNIYLNKHKFCATEPSDLYNALQKAVEGNNLTKYLGNLLVSDIMQTWDSNPGYPLITVERNYEDGLITISQSRYFRDKSVDDNTTWYVPISYAFEEDKNLNFNDTTADVWLTSRNQTFSHAFGTSGWYLINKQQTGVYQVNYDLINWERLAEYLNSENYKLVHPINRAQLLYDSFHFAQKGILPYNIALNISKHLERDVDYITITTFLKNLMFVNSMVQNSQVYDHFKDYVINLLNSAYDYLGFDENLEDAHINKKNRIQILNWMCRLGHSESRHKALHKLREWKKTGNLDVPQNLKQTVMCCAMKNATLEDWIFVYNQSQSATTKIIDYDRVLGCSDDPNILN